MAGVSTMTYAEFCDNYGFTPEEDISPDAIVSLDESQYKAIGIYGDEYEGTLEEITSDVINLYQEGLTETTWERLQLVYVARVQDKNGNLREYDVEVGWHMVTVDPIEPECWRDYGHEWSSPYKILGGIKENPGVWGHGGGVFIKEVCKLCGAYRFVDTWAQDRNTGKEGLRSVEYAEADAASWCYSCAGVEDWFDDAPVEWRDTDTAIVVFDDRFGDTDVQYARDLVEKTREKLGEFWHIEVDDQENRVTYRLERRR